MSQVIANVDSYPTKTDIVVVTDNGDATRNWREHSSMVHGLDFRVHHAEHLNKSQLADLAWRHRDVATEAMATGGWTPDPGLGSDPKPSLGPDPDPRRR